MKPCIKFLLPVLVSALCLILAGRAAAQTFTVLHTFTGSPTDGANPTTGLTLSGNALYGTTYKGGSSGYGTVFAVNTDGTGFTNLYNFGPYTNGANPAASLFLSGTTLYGTTVYGGTGGVGTVFALNIDGTGFTNLHSFTATFGIDKVNSDGANPYAGLILSGNTLYGAAANGGSSGEGTVFAVNTDGTGFTNLHSFTGYADGAIPSAGLILSANTLYGTAYTGGFSGGAAGNGIVFSVNTNGTAFTNLYEFNGSSDGALPYAGLILSSNTLYGTANHCGSSGFGSSGNGTVFAVNTDGTGFTTLHSFPAMSTNTSGVYTNGEGAIPDAGLILSGNTLYGTTYRAGSSGNGTVFSISFRPQLTITLSDTNVILTWPTNFVGFDYTGYTLQSTTNLVLSVWTTNSPAPVVVNGQNTVTNPISGTQKFYRLSQ